MVEIDELHPVGERREARLQAAMVGAGAAMDEEGRRLLAHARSVRDEAHPVDVEIDLGVSNAGAHGFLRIG